jgi:hypothetical protein
MDQLSQKEQEKIRKMSDTRLVTSLTRAGIDPDEIEAMERTALIDRWAKLVAEGHGQGSAAGATVGKTATGYDVKLERERLAFEKQKWEAELELEKAKILAQQAEREAQAQLEKREINSSTAELENKRKGEITSSARGNRTRKSKNFGPTGTTRSRTELRKGEAIRTTKRT